MQIGCDVLVPQTVGSKPRHLQFGFGQLVGVHAAAQTSELALRNVDQARGSALLPDLFRTFQNSPRVPAMADPTPESS